ncbi:MAG: beta-ketoacyl-[acyl-carrier-protein] synthase family protein [Planctomycetia bacterium]|nr:beta-ketoacyl-[acyl-carrier-protein] synthase family protein [Planctomycetia bacterium]
MAAAGSHRRIVVTGRGLVTPIGRSADEVWRRWAAGECAAGPVRRFDASTLHTRIASEVPNFHSKQELKSGRLVRLLRPGEDFGYVAAGAAFADAGLATGQFDSKRAGIAIGCRKEGPKVENFFAGIKAALDPEGRVDHQKFIEDGMKLIPPQTIVEGLPNACMYYIAHEYVLQGVNYNFLSLGSGGTMALGESLRAIRRGEADLMLAGGYDSWVNWVYLAQLSNRQLLTQNNDDPQHAHRPFDVHRSGSVAGEGAGLMILEEYEAARQRSATIHGELLGYAATTGVPHADHPHSARLLAECIARALKQAQCRPTDIDFVHLTGDATPSGDEIESRALLDVFGAHGRSVPVTTLKSATGHLGNASGSVELAVMLESMRRGTLLPIVNLERPDPALPLAFVRTPVEGLALRRGLMLSRGWPSHYTALVAGRPA